MEQVIHSQLKHVHTNFVSEICYSIWFNGKKWSLRNGVGQTIAKMWILTVHPTSAQQFKVILSSFNSIRGLPTGCLCLLVSVAWAVTGRSGVNGNRASSLYSCTTTKFVQMEYQVTAAGQLSLIKWNNRSHKFFLHSTNWIWMINPDQVNVVCVGRFLTL